MIATRGRQGSTRLPLLASIPLLAAGCLADFEELRAPDPLDPDVDGVRGDADNCPNVVNREQVDTDGDGAGDACDEDDDGDGLSDTVEEVRGTDPLQGDTDGDGLSDSDEVRLGLRPDEPDTDGDGERDDEEVGPDPFKATDTDGDGLIDALESGTADVDGDGAPDELDGPGPEGDQDGDGVRNGEDVCPVVWDPEQLDQDDDGRGDECDPDADGDGLTLAQEVAVGTNPLSPDTDGDGARDDAEVGADIGRPVDTDGDGRIDALESADTDSDGDGAMDELDGPGDAGDLDGDGVLNAEDNCRDAHNEGQADQDGDDVGDACDPDLDGDDVPNERDNCPEHENADQLDTDSDDRGDLCDADDDNDGLPDEQEEGEDALRPDRDGDGVLDGADNCPDDVNAGQEDADGDRAGDACDLDDDDDEVTDEGDNCPLLANGDQADEDRDGAGDVCDEDEDGDGLAHEEDLCPLFPDPEQADLDGDGRGDYCDDDDDDDGAADAEDNCPWVPNPLQEDADGDDVGDRCDGLFAAELADGEATDLVSHGDDMLVATSGAGVIRYDGTTGDLLERIGHADGLLSNRVLAIDVAPDGSLWMGTDRGISVLDPEGRWDRHLPGPESIRAALVVDIACGPDGAVYAAVPDAVCGWDGAGWEVWRRGEEIVDGEVRALALSPEGRLWVGTTEGVSYRWERGDWRTIPMNWLPSPRINRIVFEGDDYLWLLTERGPVELSQDLDDWGYWNGASTLSFAKDPQGRIWLGYERALRQVWRDEDGRSYLRRPSQRVYATGARSLAVGPDGVLWAAGRDGVQRCTASVQMYTEEDGLGDDRVNDVLVLGEDVWVATDAGVSRLSDDGMWTSWTEEDGLPPGPARSLCHSWGELWVGVGADGLVPDSGGVARRDQDGEWTAWRQEDPDLDDVRSVAHDGLSLWAGTSGGLLRRSWLFGWSTLEEVEGLELRPVSALHHDGDRLWVLVEEGGLVRHDDLGGWTVWRQEEWPLPDRLQGIAGDGAGVWVAGSGVATLTHLSTAGLWESWGGREILPSWLEGLFHDGHSLWATASGLFRRLPDGRWSAWGPVDGLPGDLRGPLHVEGQEVWAAVEDGLVRVSDPDEPLSFRLASWDPERLVAGPDGFLMPPDLRPPGARRCVESRWPDLLMCATPTGLFVSDDAGAGWRTYTTADGLLSDDVRDIGFDGSVTWILTDAGVSGAAVDSDSLLYLGSFTEENSAGGLPSDDTRAVLVGGDWVHVGTAGGVGRCTHDECAHWWVVQEADESVRALSLDALDNIWAATDGGLAWNELGGFWGDWASLPGLSGVPVRAVASGAPGSAHACLTYAATPQGLYAVDTDGVRERYEYGHGLPSDDLTDVFIDAEGVVWLATGAGVVRVDTELVPAGPDRAPATCEQPLRCWEGSTWSDPCRHAPTVSAWQGSCGGRGPEAVLEFEAPEDGTWVFDTDGSDFDTLLYVRTACTEPASELECDDDGGGAGSSSRAEAWLNEGQVVYVFVDGYFAFSSGTWVLNVSQ